MPASRKKQNPFYILLLLAGCAFAVTAFAYGVMTVRELQLGRSHAGMAAASGQVPENDGFSNVMDRYGPRLMLVELLLLAVGTFGAMAVDQYADHAVELAPQRDHHTNSKLSPDESRSSAE